MFQQQARLPGRDYNCIKTILIVEDDAGVGAFLVQAFAQETPYRVVLAADGLHKLAEFGAQARIAVIVENHGGLSSNGQWLTGVMKMVGHPNCGTLPRGPCALHVWNTRGSGASRVAGDA